MDKKKGIITACILIPVIVVVIGAVGGAGVYLLYNYISGNEASVNITELFSKQEPVEDMEAVTEVLSTDEAISLLNGLDLSLSRIQEIEEHCVHDGSADDEALLKARLIALKHVYTEVFLTNEHSVQILRNIYTLHARELSPQQRAVLKDFLDRPYNELMDWERMSYKAENFDDFAYRVNNVGTVEIEN